MKYTYTFDQLKDTEENARIHFLNYQYTVDHFGPVDLGRYFTADRGTVEAPNEQLACEKLFQKYNIRDDLQGYAGRSMSVSDVVHLRDNSADPPVETVWFCDNIGFVRVEV